MPTITSSIMTVLIMLKMVLPVVSRIFVAFVFMLITLYHSPFCPMLLLMALVEHSMNRLMTEQNRSMAAA